MRRFKKILLINSIDTDTEAVFRSGFVEACKDLGVDLELLDTHELMIAIADDKITLYRKGQPFKVETSAYHFIRSRRHDPWFTTIICHVLKHFGADFNDELNLHHGQEDSKITQMVKLAAAGLPVPKSIIFTRDSFRNNKTKILNYFSYPVVLKTSGSRGRNVWKVESSQELKALILKESNVFLIQEVIPNDYDLRILVFKNRVLGAISRSLPGKFQNNISLGGVAQVAQLSEDEKRAAVEATQIVGMDFAGVDIIRTDNSRGFVFLEVNKTPQVIGFNSVHKTPAQVKLVKEIIDH